MGEILNRVEAAGVAKKLTAREKKIVFTNGCFDIVHVGHARMFKEARKLGDVLIVGLNSDASVQRLKGPQRPIFKELERAELLCAFETVDYVAIFEEDTPYELICEIRPHVLVKGADWAQDQIVGRDVVEAGGGKVIRLHYHTGFSTSAMIERLKRT